MNKMDVKSLHILLVNNYTIRCGVPAAVTALANSMAERGHMVTIITQKHTSPTFFWLKKIINKLHDLSQPTGTPSSLPFGCEPLAKIYPLHQNIQVIPYNFTDNNLKIQKLRKKIKALGPDVCVCPLPDGSHIVWAVTLLGTGIPYVYSEHHNPDTIENKFWTRKGRLAAMSGADAIHLLLPQYLNSLPDFLRQKAVAIPNAIELPPSCADPVAETAQRKNLLWLGRLHDELKQCRLAMDAFALIGPKFPDWDLLVAGDGQDRAMIHAHAENLMTNPQLQGRIKFLGEQNDVWPVYASAQAFCFSSKTEGLPFVLLETLASGLPVAAFKDCPGVADLITHQVNGLLADEMTAQAMAGQLNQLLADSDLRVRLGKNARQGLQDFSPQTVYDKWEDLLRNVTAKETPEMDSFNQEPFASLARLSSCARREWLWRDFGKPVPYSLEANIKYFCAWPLRWFKTKIMNRER